MSQDKSNHSSLRDKLILIVFGLSGLTALVYEIIWIRPLSLVFGTTTYAVSIIIAAFLSGLALGSWIAGRFSDKVENPLKIYGFIEIGIGLYGLMLISLFSALPGIYLGLYQSTFPNLGVFYVLQFILAFVIILIPTTLMGATLPMIMKSYSRKFSDLGKDIGKIYSVNNIGAVLGTLAAGFVLMPLLGIQASITIVAILNIGIGIIVLVASKSKNTKKILGIVIIVVIASSFSVYDFKLMQFGLPYYTNTEITMEFVNSFVESQEVLFHKESMYSSVSVVSFDDGSKIMKISGKNQCSNSPSVVEGMNRLGYIGYDLYKHNFNDEPSNALNIGLGCGYTSKWLGENVDTTTIEIDPVIIDASKLFVEDIKHDLVTDDARNWLTRNTEKFDLISLQPSDPFTGWYLYTSEFFLLLDNNLTKNGIVVIWVPVFEMTENDFHVLFNTFNSIFPYVHIYQQEEGSAQLMFIGSQNELEIKEKNLYIVSEKQVPYVKTPLNTDDRPVLEFSTALNQYNKNPVPLFEKFKGWSLNN